MADENKTRLSGLELLAALADVKSANTIPAPLPQTYEVNNRVYKNQEVQLDGYTFRNCAFINCVLVTLTGNFHIDSCHFHLGQIYFGGNAFRSIQLSSLLWGTDMSGFRGKVEPDGSITIP